MTGIAASAGSALLSSTFAPMETLRNVLLVALLLGLAWVLFQRMAHAMRKRDDIPHEWVDFEDAAVSWEGSRLRIKATSKTSRIERLTLSIADPQGNFSEVIFEGPVQGRDLEWEWTLSEDQRGSVKVLEIEIATAHTKVMRRVAIPKD